MGYYQFRDLVPGSYQVIQTQPPRLADGIDRAGDAFYAAGTDTLPLELAQGSDVTGYYFGERGRLPTAIALTDFFASAHRESVLLASDSEGTGQWYSIEAGWPDVKLMSFQIQPDQDLLTLQMTTTEPSSYTATLNTHSSSVQRLNRDGSFPLMRVLTASTMLVPSDGDNRHAISAITDTNTAADFVLDNAALGTTVGITAFAEDLDGDDIVTYSLVHNAGGRFAVTSGTGVVTVAGAIDRQEAASHDITVRASLAGGAFGERTLAIAVWEQGEGESPVTASRGSQASASILMRPTPADAYLAADMLLSAAAPWDLSPWTAEVDTLHAAANLDEYVQALDDLLAGALPS